VEFQLLRFAHLVGLILMGAGLIGVFVCDLRSRQVSDLNLFAQGVSFLALFYDGLVVPGALVLLASGTWLIVGYHGGWRFLTEPWLAGMVALFAFEFIEGNTITRLYFMRLRRLTRHALAEGRVTAELARARREQLASFTHFLDIPILLVIVSLEPFATTPFSALISMYSRVCACLTRMRVSLRSITVASGSAASLIPKPRTPWMSCGVIASSCGIQEMVNERIDRASRQRPQGAGDDPQARGRRGTGPGLSGCRGGAR
jgi:predicted integral membrane protein DUF2269